MNLRPTQANQITELSRFLSGGAGSPRANLSEQVLRWKYFHDATLCRSVVVCDTRDRIIGHVGICPREFCVSSRPEARVRTLHFIDWRASPAHPMVGQALARHGFTLADTQYALGGSEAGLRMGRRLGYAQRAAIRAYRKVVNPLYPVRWALRSLSRGEITRSIARLASAVRTRGSGGRSRPGVPLSIDAKPVEAFGAEVEAILIQHASDAKHARRDAAHSDRHAALLNYYLQCPIGEVRGWLLERRGDPVGFALTGVLERPQAREGRIIECLLVGSDDGLWCGAVAALLRQMGRIDIVTALGSTSSMAEALIQHGFAETEQVPLLIRDRRGQLPPGTQFHVSYLEADLAYI